jgi:acyl carrier protein
VSTRTERLGAFLAELRPDTCTGLAPNASLIVAGLIDSLALLELAGWIEAEIGEGVDPGAFDLSEEWDTMERILAFIERRRTDRNA